MIRVVALLAAVCGVLFLSGFIIHEPAHRLNIRTLDEDTQFTVSITLPDVTDEYRWLSVYVCSADQTESGVYCTGWFERESTQEIYRRKQYLFTWRRLPKGLIQITAVAFDVDDKPLARNQVRVFR